LYALTLKRAGSAQCLLAWFTIRRSNKQYLLDGTRRCGLLRVAVDLLLDV